MLLFTVVILPWCDCDFYRKSLQTGPRRWEVETQKNTFIHSHTNAHTQIHTQRTVYMQRGTLMLVKDKALVGTLKVKVRADL